MTRGKTIVLAERVEDVVIVTPRTLDRARGVIGEEVLAAKGIAGQPGYRELWEAIEPCFATRGPRVVNPQLPPSAHCAECDSELGIEVLSWLEHNEDGSHTVIPLGPEPRVPEKGPNRG